MKKKKFFIITTVPTTLYFFQGLLRLLNKDFVVRAVSSIRSELTEFGDQEGIATHYVPMERPISLLKDPISLLRFIWLFATERPYIVHGNTPKGSFLSMIAAWITRRPIRIYMCHGLRYQGYAGKMRKLLMTMERISCRCATHVLAVSHGAKNTLLNDRICPPHKLNIVGDGSAGGIDLSMFDRDKINPSPEVARLIPLGNYIFCFVGRIVKDKGINEMVKAFTRLREEHNNVSLLIVGQFEDAENPVDDFTRQELKTNPDIHLVGEKSDVKPYILASNVLLLPSYREGLPTVPIEAGALGIPAIVSDIPGCNEVVHHEANGLLVKPRDAQSLYQAMKRAVENREEIAAMGGKARSMVESRYEQQSVWARYITHYNHLATQ